MPGPMTAWARFLWGPGPSRSRRSPPSAAQSSFSPTQAAPRNKLGAALHATRPGSTRRSPPSAGAIEVQPDHGRGPYATWATHSVGAGPVRRGGRRLPASDRIAARLCRGTRQPRHCAARAGSARARRSPPTGRAIQTQARPGRGPQQPGQCPAVPGVDLTRRSPPSAARSSSSPTGRGPQQPGQRPLCARAGSTRRSPPTTGDRARARLCRGPRSTWGSHWRSGPARRGDRRLSTARSSSSRIRPRPITTSATCSRIRAGSTRHWPASAGPSSSSPASPGREQRCLYLVLPSGLRRARDPGRASPLGRSSSPAPGELASSPMLNDRSPDRRLRIGYVSPDFRVHPVGRFMLPLLESHDHSNFEIFCYSSFERPGRDHRRCRARPMSGAKSPASPMSSSPAPSARIEIDILVDLTMHMANNRLLVFARKPAPVQVTYLAYCGTTGLGTMDYRLTDPLSRSAGPGRADYYRAVDPSARDVLVLSAGDRDATGRTPCRPWRPAISPSAV